MVWFRNSIKTVKDMRAAIAPMVAHWEYYHSGSRYEVVPVPEKEGWFVGRAWLGSELLVEVWGDCELQAYEFLGRGVICQSTKIGRMIREKLLAPSSNG